MTTLRKRVVDAAEVVLQGDGAVGPLELLQQIGFLEYSHVQQWRKGNPYYATLEPHIQCGEKKLTNTYKFFFEWVQEQGLEPMEASYIGASRHGGRPLQVTEDGDAERETFFRTHFRRADLSPAKRRQLEKKSSKVPDLLVYIATSRESNCSECSVELPKGSFLFLEQQQALCLTCADMDHLEFLASGDAALTRRAKKHSPLSAIVLKFSRSRKRYERQGILAAPKAIAQAEDECTADADQRAKRRELDAARRQHEDRQLVESMTREIIAEFPGCSSEEAGRIAQHTAVRGSGRIGRSAAARELDPAAILLAVKAWIRHQHTQYDSLLMKGVPRLDARDMIRAELESVLAAWREL